MSMKNGRLRETLRFAVTGGVCFLVEAALLFLLHDVAHMDTLLAAPIAFLVSVALNYALCVVWVFDAKGQDNKARAGFLLTSLAGLALNELFMLIFRHLFGEEGVVLTVFGFAVRTYMINKVLSTLLVMIWNYFTKRFILGRKQKSE